MAFLEDFKIPCGGTEAPDRELLTCVAKTALRSKLRQELADKLTTIVVGTNHACATGFRPLCRKRKTIRQSKWLALYGERTEIW